MTKTETPRSKLLDPETARTIIDPSAYGSSGAIIDVHRRLRRENPIARAEIEGYDPFWVLTKHADIREVSQKAEIFPSGVRAVFLVDRAGQQRIRDFSGRDGNLSHSILTMDGPEHMQHRKITQSWFMPRNLKQLEPRLRLLAREHIDRMLAGDGTCDFPADVAVHYPLQVILEIMGIPQSEEPYILQLTRELMGSQDPDYARTAKDRMADNMAGVFTDFHDYFRSVIEDRRASPRDDVATVIANGEVDGEPIALDIAVAYLTTLATAGHDTTSSTLSGAIEGLCAYPDQFAKIKANPDLLSGLVEEALRWTTPIRHFMRTAVAEYTVRDHTFVPGDRLMLNYLSANRDEDVFDDPYSFNIERHPNPHLSFGYGLHGCLGRHLAKLELEIFLGELLPRISSVEQFGSGRELATILMGGLKSLNVRFAA